MCVFGVFKCQKLDCRMANMKNVYLYIEQWFMIGVRPSSYGRTREVPKHERSLRVHQAMVCISPARLSLAEIRELLAV